MAILPIDSGRYGSPEMAAVFSEERRLRYQLDVEGAVAAAQAAAGVIPARAGREILRASRSGRVTPARVRRIEAVTRHDTAALVRALGEEAGPAARPWVHYGLTSNDLVDTATSLQMRAALDVVEPKVGRLAAALAGLALRHAGLPAAGRTHGQHASVMSFGLKFANWADELAAHLGRLAGLRRRALVCKALGVVGTGSLMGARAPAVQRAAAARLGLRPVRVATQVAPREGLAEYSFALALVGATLDRAAVEVRNLQRTEIAEASEGFGRGQMGSSAVPVKRNPVRSERVSSLARVLRAQVQVSMENVALWHERDLSNSAAERFTVPTSSLLLDQMLEDSAAVAAGLRVDEARVRANLGATGGQIYAEFVMEAMMSRGMGRREAYGHVQRVAFAASGSGEPFLDALAADRAVSSALTRRELEAVFEPSRHLGASASIIRGVARAVERATGLRVGAPGPARGGPARAGRARGRRA